MFTVLDGGEQHRKQLVKNPNAQFYPSAVAITQGGAIQLANNGTDGVQGLQTLTMANTAAAQPGATILQYAQTSDGQQILVPSNQVVVQGGKMVSTVFRSEVPQKLHDL